MPTKILGALFGMIVFAFVLTLVAIGGRYITYRQTDPDDIVTRDRIDRQIDAWIERLDRQIQADSVLLVAGTEAQVVYLDRKYPDTDYQIFLAYRVWRVATSLFTIIPTTDSSFTITKGSTDVSTLHWMTIRK